MKRIVLIIASCLLISLVSCQKEDEFAIDPKTAAASGVNLKPGAGEKLYKLSFKFNTPAGSLPKGYAPTPKSGNLLGIYDVTQEKVQKFMFSLSVGAGSRTTSLQALGVMSSQYFTTKAIFPYSAITAWTGADDYSCAAPKEQTVTEGSILDTTAPVFVGDLNTSGTVITFKSAVSFLGFHVTRDNVTSLEFSFGKDSSESDSYRISVPEGSFTAGDTYYLTVTPGEYSSVYVVETTGTESLGFNIPESFSFEAGNAGYDLGTFDEKVSSGYRVTSEREIANVTTYLKASLLYESLDEGMKSNATAVLGLFYSKDEMNAPVVVVNYEYTSIDPYGKPVTLSSALMMPKAAYTGQTPVKKLALANHFSIMKNAECPTLSNNTEGILTWKNVAIVLPDYYGFGASSECCQAYLNPDMSGRGALDALLAARQIMADKNIDLPEGTVNLGYSQGGYNAIANLRYLSLHPSYDISFEQTFAGGGPYDVYGTFTQYISGGYGTVFPLVLVSLTSFNELEHLGISYSDIFKGALLENYKEWILSKKYSTSEVIALLGDTIATNHLTETLTSGASNAILEKFREVAQRYSLTEGWTPLPGTKIRLYHSEYDDMVPYSNFEALKTFLDGKCELDTTSYTSTSNTHTMTYLNFLIGVLNNLKN